MKILIVCPRLCHGGAERVGVVLANSFSKKNEVFVASDLTEEITYNLASKVKLFNIIAFKGNKIIKWICAIYLLRKLIVKFHPDAIVGIMELCSFVSKVASLGLSIPIIATEHNSFERPKSAPMSKINYFAKFYLNKVYDVVTLLTAADKKVIGKKLKNAIVMPNPLCLDIENAIPPKKNIILAVGRVDDWHCKGFDVLISSWGNIAKDFPTWKLWIVGACREERNKLFLNQLGRRYGCSQQLEFFDFQTDMKKIYAESSVFVLSSRYEGFGLVLIEAMSQGCACIACDYKGRQKEIIRNRDEGLLCEPDNSIDLSFTLKQILSDSKLRIRLQQNALSRAEYYSLDNTMNRWNDLLQSVCSKAD